MLKTRLLNTLSAFGHEIMSVKEETTESLRNLVRQKIHQTLRTSSSEDTRASDLKHFNRVKEVVRQLRDVGWSNVASCDADFERVTFVFSTSGETLTLNVTLDADFPASAPVCDDKLPKTFALKSYVWSPNESSLDQIFKTFVNRAESLVPVIY